MLETKILEHALKGEWDEVEKELRDMNTTELRTFQDAVSEIDDRIGGELERKTSSQDGHA